MALCSLAPRALPFLLCLSCSSEPLAPSAGDESGGIGGSGGSTTGGTGGSTTGGSGGSTAGTGGTTAPDYSNSPCYGEKRTTLVYDFGTHMPRETTATCRAEGERTLVYVADELWEMPFTQSEVNAFMAGYEVRGRSASFRPDLGVLPTDELVFGPLSGPLNEGRLAGEKLPIFVVNSGGAGDGYLCSWCDGVELHLDGPLLMSLHTDRALSIAAHESVHAIHRGYDANEAVWVDETLAQAAMTVNGFFTDQAWLEGFLDGPNVAWGPGVEDPRGFDYGAGLLFGTYLWERGGADLLSAITLEPLDEWAGIDAALAATGDPDDGFGVFTDMALSVFLDDPASGYSFDAFDLAGGVVPAIVETGTTYEDTLAAYGLVFVVLDEQAREVTLDAPDSVTARIAFDDAESPPVVLDLPLGEPFALGGIVRVLVITGRATAPFTLTVEG